ncbi:MAG: Hsp20/alpha crystallin family protein [Pseudomonadales bacterium]
MITKTEWLGWVDTTTARLQQSYRDVWTRLQRSPSREQPASKSKQWSAIRPEIERKQSSVEIRLELPQPHTVEADVRVIGSSLVISVLRHGSGIDGAPAEDCYRRAIPIPDGADPYSAEHRVYGGEIVIRLRQTPENAGAAPSAAPRRRRPARTNARKSTGTTTKPTRVAKGRGTA